MSSEVMLLVHMQYSTQRAVSEMVYLMQLAER